MRLVVDKTATVASAAETAASSNSVPLTEQALVTNIRDTRSSESALLATTDVFMNLVFPFVFGCSESTERPRASAKRASSSPSVSTLCREQGRDLPFESEDLRGESGWSSEREGK